MRLLLTSLYCDGYFCVRGNFNDIFIKYYFYCSWMCLRYFRLKTFLMVWKPFHSKLLINSHNLAFYPVLFFFVQMYFLNFIHSNYYTQTKELKSYWNLIACKTWKLITYIDNWCTLFKYLFFNIIKGLKHKNSQKFNIQKKSNTHLN